MTPSQLRFARGSEGSSGVFLLFSGEPSAEGTNTLCSQVRETCPVGNRPLLTKFTVSILLHSIVGSLP